MDIKILIIEDDIIDQRTIKRALDKSFLDVTTTFLEGIDSESEPLLKEDWDLILTDYNLPRLNGVEIIKFLRKEIGSTVPILVMTGMESETVAKEALEAGAFDFLGKDLITPEGIGLAVRNAIRITEQQKKTVELLKKLQKREEQLVETQRIAGLGTWDYDLNSNKLDWSNESYSIFGRDIKKGPPEYDEFLNSVIEEDRDILLDAIDNAIWHHISYEIVTRHINESTGEIVYVSGRGAPFFVEDNLEKLNGTFVDVTKEKIAEQELIKARLEAEGLARLKQDFLANMSHEIRTPMNAILGFTDIVLKEQLSDFSREKIGRIKQAGNNLLVIINDILDFSKIEAGQLEIENVKFDLYKCVDQVKSQLDDLAKAKNLRLIFNIDEQTPRIVKGDSVRVTQILTNLINNSIKFTSKGFVEIRLFIKEESPKTTTIQFEVEDTGIGIPKDKQESMFESFTQASSDTTRKYGGTGLGLAICKSLVELQNGKIWVESEEGKGSTFKFTINFGVCVQSLDEEVDVEEEIDLSGVKLLLVEDNLMNRELASHFLNQWNVDFDIAENGKIGFKKVIAHKYDVVLMDISMPVMDGYAATEAIRSSESERKNTPIIAMTANAFSNDIEKCFEIGMNDHISKPFKAPELKQKINSLVKHGKAFTVDAEHRKKKAQKKKSKGPEQLISLDMLKEMGGGNMDFVKEMLGIYLSETPLTIERIENAVKGGDKDELKAAAHKFRSPAGLMGISSAVELAEFIELNVFEESKNQEVEIAVDKLIAIAKESIEQTKALEL